MVAVARPTLAPRVQTLNYTENEVPTSFSRHGVLSSNSLPLWLEGRETKAWERRVCCCGSPAGYLRGICAAVYGSPDPVFLMTYLRWPAGHADLLLLEFPISFSISVFSFMILAIGCRSWFLSEPEWRPISALFFLKVRFTIYDYDFGKTIPLTDSDSKYRLYGIFQEWVDVYNYRQ